MLVEALQFRLKVLEDEIVRFSKLASATVDQSEQDNYWQLAQDVQREARLLRAEIWKETQEQSDTHLTSDVSHPASHDPSKVAQRFLQAS